MIDLIKIDLIFGLLFYILTCDIFQYRVLQNKCPPISTDSYELWSFHTRFSRVTLCEKSIVSIFEAKKYI